MKYVLKRAAVITPLLIAVQLFAAPMLASAAQQITIDIGSIDRIQNCQASEAECQERIEATRLLVQALLRQILETQYPDLPNGDEYYKQESYLEDLKETPLGKGEKQIFNISDGEAQGVDRDTHPVYRETWRVFQAMVPQKYLDEFSEIHFYNDETDRYSALVYQKVSRRGEDESVEWRLNINLDNFSLDQGDYNEAVETLTHEVGHVLLMNADQMSYFEDEDECATYYVPALRGCAKTGSYYDAIRAHWSDDFLEWSAEWEGDLRSSELSDDTEERLEEYYEDHKDEFVSMYAASGPNEDAAETIAHLARDDISEEEDTIAAGKVYTLLEFEELETLRERVQELLR